MLHPTSTKWDLSVTCEGSYNRRPHSHLVVEVQPAHQAVAGGGVQLRHVIRHVVLKVTCSMGRDRGRGCGVNRSSGAHASSQGTHAAG